MKHSDYDRANIQHGFVQPHLETPRRYDKSAGFIATFIIMAVFWVIFSMKFDYFHLSLGAVSCLLVAALSSDLLFPSGIRLSIIRRWVGFCLYIPWLLYQIFLANLHVVRLVFHPRMMDLIDPKIIEFDSQLKSDISRTTFANSITLTPGTITVNVSARGTFSVHCIDAQSGEGLPGEMEARVARVFGE
jgi:multicomponent Na+:H+ antiporter subunit E